MLTGLVRQFSDRLLDIVPVATEWGSATRRSHDSLHRRSHRATARAHELTLVTRDVVDMVETGARPYNPFR